MEYKEIALGALHDIDGAFEGTSFAVLTEAAERNGVEYTIESWINTMYEGRNITATLSGETHEVSMARSCQQGSVLSPLLWSLVVDELLEELNEGGYHARGYADGTAILINGKFPQTVSEVLQTVLGLVQQWRDRTGLSIHLSKMVVIAFTKQRVLKGLKEPTLFLQDNTAVHRI
jgi:hypothetical protein